MANDVNLNDNLYKCNTLEELRKDTPGDTEQSYEEITILKTEVKEESYDCDMATVDVETQSVKEECTFLPEISFDDESSALVRGTEESSNENFECESVEIKSEAFADNEHKSFSSDKEPQFKSYEIYAYIKEQLPQGHVQLQHNDPSKIYKCEQCVYSTPFRACFLIHTRNHTKTLFKCAYKSCACPPSKGSCECLTCEYGAVRKEDLNKHILETHSAMPKVYACRVCKYTTLSKEELLEHVRKYKGSYKYCKSTLGIKKSYKRITCESETAQNSRLKEYTFCTKQRKKYKCTYCTFSTIYKKCLETHVATHLNDHKIKCPCGNCAPGEEMSIKTGLKGHILQKWLSNIKPKFQNENTSVLEKNIEVT